MRIRKIATDAGSVSKTVFEGLYPTDTQRTDACARAFLCVDVVVCW